MGAALLAEALLSSTQYDPSMWSKEGHTLWQYSVGSFTGQPNVEREGEDLLAT